MKIGAYIKSMRLRTLPLSLAGVIAGIFLSISHASECGGSVGWGTIVFLVLTTVFLQILSNLSNELGDTLSGTDTADRQGIHYAMQDGEMTIDQMKRLIKVIACSCLISGVIMIYLSFGTLIAVQPVVLMLLGASAVWAAVRYTLGHNPYGYRGLGDVFVFIFFGLVSVIGAFYVCSHTLSLALTALPGVAIGLFSMGVLNVNNIRDMKTDAVTRVTVALKMGLKRARVYHTFLICGGCVAMVAQTLIYGDGLWSWLFIVSYPLLGLHLKGVWTRVDRQLDPMLPMLVMSTFLLSVLYGVGLVI